jgi:hypothetical protein
MIQMELDNNRVLAVDSHWDSGTHKGFGAAVGEYAGYGNTSTLDKVLTKEQIKSVEYMIAAMVKGYLKGG